MHIDSFKFNSFGQKHFDQLNEIVYNSSEYLQPMKTSGSTQMCEGILVSALHYVPIEVAVPCGMKLERITAICTWKMGDSSQKKLTSVLSESNSLFQAKYTCPPQWTAISDEYCLQFVPAYRVYVPNYLNHFHIVKGSLQACEWYFQKAAQE